MTPYTKEDFLDAYSWAMLPDCIWHESRGEPFEGQVAVGEVILARMADPRWPNTVAGVALQPWQFSCYNANDPNNAMRPKPSDKVGWRSFLTACEAAAKAVENHRSGQTITNGANHYLAPNVVKRLPAWYDPEKIVAVVGAHEFLRL